MNTALSGAALVAAADRMAGDEGAMGGVLGARAFLFCAVAAGNALPFATSGASRAREGANRVKPLFLPLRRKLTLNPFISIGRLDGNDVALLDSSVSRFHAMVFEDERGFSLVDAGSKLGTYVGDARAPVRGAAPLALRSRQHIRFGAMSTLFVALDDAIALAREDARSMTS